MNPPNPPPVGIDQVVATQMMIIKQMANMVTELQKSDYSRTQENTLGLVGDTPRNKASLFVKTTTTTPTTSTTTTNSTRLHKCYYSQYLV
jgi:hypothetical protein